MACDNSLRRSLLKRVLAALPPQGTHTVRANSVPWRELAPGITIQLLRVDPEAENMTAFVRMQPGSVFDPHRHAQCEECLILEGEIFIGGYRLGAGDMHVAAPGTEHARHTSPRGALMLVRAQRL